MKITQNTVPSVAYSLFVEGNLVDQATEEQPLQYLAGVGGMILGFEKQMEGLQAGDGIMRAGSAVDADEQCRRCVR